MFFFEGSRFIVITWEHYIPYDLLQYISAISFNREKICIDLDNVSV